MPTYCSIESEASGLWASGLDISQPILGNEGIHGSWAGCQGHGAGAGRGSGGESLMSKAIDHS